MPGLRISDTLTNINFEHLANTIADDSCLVEFFKIHEMDPTVPNFSDTNDFSKDRYLAFIINKNLIDQIILVDLGDADEIESLIKDFRRLILEKGTESLIATRLSNALLDKLTPYLMSCESILLALDGELLLLPFEAIPYNDHSLLTDQYQISYINTGRELVNLIESDLKESSDSLIIGDPAFDYQINASEEEEHLVALNEGRFRESYLGLEKFKSLPCSGLECELVADFLGTTAWMGTKATKEVIKNANCPQILHLATHGFYLASKDNNPSRLLINTVIWDFSLKFGSISN
jgi:CHAT domain-containing protein